MAWYTPQQLEARARDLKNVDQTMAEAADMEPGPAWHELNDAQRTAWRDRAKGELDAITPLDISRPLQLRDGRPVTDVRLSADGMGIEALVQGATQPWLWPINGLTAEGRSAESSTDLVYAAQVPA